MEYGKWLIDTAAKACGGSRYALSQTTKIPEQNLSAVYLGKRQFPLAWVVPLAELAGVDPSKAWAEVTAERARKKPLGSGFYSLGVAAVTLLVQMSNVCGVDSIRIVSTRGRSLSIRTRWPGLFGSSSRRVREAVPG
jgi:hypothetical protein